MQKFLIILGVLILIIGLGWPLFSKIPIGRLPGDIVVNKPNVKFFFPITSMIIISVVLTLVLRLFSK